MKKLRGFYIGVYGDPTAKELAIEDHFEKLQETIDCRCFTIVQRKIGGKYYDIVADDEGLFVENAVPSAVNSRGEVMLVGNLFICRHKGPDLKSLTDNEVAAIKKNLRLIVTTRGVTPVIVCEY